jgi:hypothetical protein
MSAVKLPAWSGRRDLLLIALGVAVVIGAKLLVVRVRMLGVTLGDTDDAMRLVMVRDLLHGRGWYDQHLVRLQPPYGIFMHWSRLLDGALAAYDGLLGIMLPPGRAEWFMRLSWPLLWLPPTLVGALAITRRLGGGAALTVAAILFVLCNPAAFVQFAPGRVDHHNVQIALCVLAAAGALWSAERRSAALLAGAASGLGLAVGLEAVLIYAAIGAAIAVRFLFDRTTSRAAVLYGLSLAGVGAGAFLLQTPPSRWGLSVCDALGVNLVAATSLAGCGLALAAWATRGAAIWIRAGAIGAVGLSALGVGLGLDPACRAGPIAAVDPSIRGFWFDHITEMEPWRYVLAHDFAQAAGVAAPCVLAGLAWLWLGRTQARRGFAWALTGACLALAAAATWAAVRMGSYTIWFAVPLVACAATDLCVRYGRGLLASAAWLAVAVSPATSAWAAERVHDVATGRPAARADDASPEDACLADAAYRTLAKLPAGLVLGGPDYGPFVLAHTPHSVLSAPYHRMTWGIWTAHALLEQPAARSEAGLKRAGVAYVIVCPTPGAKPPRSGSKPASLEAALEAGAPPPWLRPVSPAGDRLKVFVARY